MSISKKNLNNKKIIIKKKGKEQETMIILSYGLFSAIVVVVSLVRH